METPIYFRISPELRRSAYYVLAAAVPLGLVFFWVSRFARDESVAAAACKGGGLFLLCMTMLWPLRWLVRLDERGIARRLLFRWDLWTWADLAGGKIEKRHDCILYDPARPCWRRSLGLGYMARDDIRYVMARINACYRLPPPPETPESVEIQYGNFFRRSIRFDSKGVQLRGPEGTRVYLWSELQRVHITRRDAIRRDFIKLEIVLPDREIDLTTATPWRGAAPEVVNEILKRHVSVDRLEEDVFGERPARRSDLEKQLAEAVTMQRTLRRLILISSLLFVGCLIWMAVFNVVQAVAMTVMAAIIYGPLFIGLHRQHQSRCVELGRRLAEYDAATETGSV